MKVLSERNLLDGLRRLSKREDASVRRSRGDVELLFNIYEKGQAILNMKSMDILTKGVMLSTRKGRKMCQEDKDLANRLFALWSATKDRKDIWENKDQFKESIIILNLHLKDLFWLNKWRDHVNDISIVNGRHGEALCDILETNWNGEIGWAAWFEKRGKIEEKDAQDIWRSWLFGCRYNGPPEGALKHLNERKSALRCLLKNTTFRPDQKFLDRALTSSVSQTWKEIISECITLEESSKLKRLTNQLTGEKNGKARSKAL